MPQESMSRVAAVAAGRPLSVAEAVERVRAVAAVPPSGSGVAVHARAFGDALEEVRAALAPTSGDGAVRDPDFTARLVVETVERYLSALRAYAAAPGTAPRCWTLLVDRGEDALPPAQFAAAGFAATLLHDLPAALLTTFATHPPSTDRRRDVDRFTAILTGRVEGVPGDLVARASRRLAWDEATRALAAGGEAAAMAGRTDDLATRLALAVLAPAPERRPEPSRATPGGFHPRSLYRSRITRPLFEAMARRRPGADGRAPVHRVMIDLNLLHPGGEQACHEEVIALVGRAVDSHGGPPPAAPEGLVPARAARISQYVVADLTEAAVRRLAALDEERDAPAIHRIWPDFRTRGQINRSAATVKADAARVSFAARGDGIVWAVLDSGIDERHRHFATHATLDVRAPVEHLDCTGGDAPLVDAAGHGTHVAGIIAGESLSTADDPIVAVRADIDGNQDVRYELTPASSMAGMAPACKLVSYKVLDDEGDGEVSSIIAALQHVQAVNNNGRDIKIHGVNLSVGYSFDPEWFACGESPLCVEVTRLVRSGVVVVVAAGNTGYGYNQGDEGSIAAGLDLTINDPGNTEIAITVGSTHRDAPYRYGVSYFSSKGPTGDGRAKPDLVAPGERILSAATGAMRAEIGARPGVADRSVHYVESSGTSMAAAHVSGVLAAFLSIRREYIGRPERLKTIFTASAGDLGRVPHFQGRGLVDLMRAIQSV